MAEDGGRETTIEPKQPALVPYIRCNAEGGPGGGVAMAELKPSLYDIYRKRRRLRHSCRYRRQPDLRRGSPESILAATHAGANASSRRDSCLVFRLRSTN